MPPLLLTSIACRKLMISDSLNRLHALWRLGTCSPSSLDQDSNTALSLRIMQKHDIGQINHTKSRNILLVYALTSACEFQC